MEKHLFKKKTLVGDQGEALAILLFLDSFNEMLS